jgi:hypothetical protein
MYTWLGKHIIGNNNNVHVLQGMVILVDKILKGLAAWAGNDMAWLGT